MNTKTALHCDSLLFMEQKGRKKQANTFITNRMTPTKLCFHCLMFFFT